MDDQVLKLLYRSFDTSLTEEEEGILQEALARSPELRREQGCIEAMRDEITAGAAESFSPFFAERVMRRIRSSRSAGWDTEPFFESLLFLFRRVAFVGAVVACLIAAYNMKSSGNISVAAAFASPELSIEDLVISPVLSSSESLQ